MTTARERLAKLIKVDGSGLSPSVCDMIRELLAERDTKCLWKYDDLHCKYDTSCGNGFFFAEDGDLPESKFKFCMYCGKEIVSE